MPPEPSLPPPGGRARISLVLLVCLAALWTAYFAKPVLAPMAIALLLKFLLSPVVRTLKRRLGVPLGLSAAVIAAGAVGGLFAATVALAPAIVHWTEELPDRMHMLEGRVASLTEPVAAISAATEKVTEKVDELTAAAMPGDKAGEPQVVTLAQPSWISTALGEVQRLAIEFLLVVVLLYLLLATDGVVLTKLQDSTSPGSTRWAVALKIVEDRLGTYVWSMLAVHGGLGVVMAVVLWFLDMPNPVLWGMVAGIGNAVPFVGPLVVTTALLVISSTTFVEIGPSVAPPAAYLLLHVLEANIVTPFLLGRWLSLSPVAIFIALTTMGFVWGLAGLLLAVPLLVALKIVCEHVPALRPLQIALDGSRPTPRPDATLDGMPVWTPPPAQTRT